jgi:uncharacterized membrane protein (UPF0127 family)
MLSNPFVVFPRAITQASGIGFFLRSLLWVGLAFAQPIWADAPQTQLPRITLQSGIHQLDVQVAATPSQRQTGLMFRQSMPQHEGMLFVFDEASVQCFWMKNTLIPLTAAFLDDQGTIVNLVDMKPLDTTSHCSKKPVRYVLETNQGWFAKRRIATGQKLSGAPFKP